jgi:hypothetical protein
MSGFRISGALLLVAGAASVIYGFSYNNSWWNQVKGFFVEDQTGNYAIGIGIVLAVGGFVMLLARGASSREG